MNLLFWKRFFRLSCIGLNDLFAFALFITVIGFMTFVAYFQSTLVPPIGGAVSTQTIVALGTLIPAAGDLQGLGAPELSACGDRVMDGVDVARTNLWALHMASDSDFKGIGPSMEFEICPPICPRPGGGCCSVPGGIVPGGESTCLLPVAQLGGLENATLWGGRPRVRQPTDGRMLVVHLLDADDDCMYRLLHVPR